MTSVSEVITFMWYVSLIDASLRTWNLSALQALVDPQDAKIIAIIPLSKTYMTDRAGWHFTNNGKYTVKSGCQVERVYPDKEKPPILIGPTVDTLKAFCWKIRCPPNMNSSYGSYYRDALLLGKICKQEDCKGIYAVTDMERQRNQWTMFSLSAHQRVKFGLSHITL